VGRGKAELAASHLRALNPQISVQVHPVRLTAANGAALLEDYELIIDCSDNFSTKFLINDLCVRLGKPAILSSVYQYEGQLQVLRPDRAGVCLRCIWPEATRDGLVGNCAEAGVLGPVPGVFGSLQALEALKLLLDLPGQLRDELLVLDLGQLSVTRVRARRAAACRNGACARLAQGVQSAAPDPRELERRFEDIADAERAGFAIIDVREPREVAAAPAPGAHVRTIPLQQLLANAGQLERTGRYLLLCASGRRSLAAAEELRARGFDAVFSLRGGLAGLEHRLPA